MSCVQREITMCDCFADNAKRMKSYTLGIKEKISAIDYLITEKESQILRTISDMCVPVADIYFPVTCKQYHTCGSISVYKSKLN
jgi:hypothetical protein